MTENNVQLSPAVGGEQFVLLASETVRDKRLSYREVGVMTMLSDLPPAMGKAGRVAVLCDGEGREGRDAVFGAVRKLQELGYLNQDLAPAGR